jgi:hypothetical protein
MPKKLSALSPVFLILLSLSFAFSNCSPDREGDEINILRNDYPEDYTTRRNEIYISPGLKGPDDHSVLAERNITSWRHYSTGTESRMAILLTDSTSSWLGLAHGLKTIGIPFTITMDYRKALMHRVVMVYPVVSGATLNANEVQELALHPTRGGTLIGVQVLGALNEAFGFEESNPSKQHFGLRINYDEENILTKEFTDPKEQAISLGNPERFKETIGTYSYSKPVMAPLATYEDKSVSIAQRWYQNGRAFAFGFDIGYMILKGYNIRHEDWNRSPMNDFEPTVDVLLRLLKNIYLLGEPDAVFLPTVPYNKDLAVCITHNINFKKGMDDAISLATQEQHDNIRSTYFIQTRYIKDSRSPLFFSEGDFVKLRQLAALGVDIQSNSVSGSPSFDQFEQGTGNEVYPDYRPYVMAFDKTYNGSIFGELRISRFLLDYFIPGNNTVAFRSSFFYIPFSYPQSLLATGYRFSSSIPANQALTHFPFQMNYNRAYESELPAFEFPVTDNDEVPPFTMDRATNAITLAKKIARYGGCFIGQVHPTTKGIKVQKQFYNALKDISWFGTIRDFGLWWAARNEITIDVVHDGSGRTIVLTLPKRIEGLAVMLPLRSTAVSVEPALKHSLDGRLIIFEIAEGTVRIKLDN